MNEPLPRIVLTVGYLGSLSISEGGIHGPEIVKNLLTSTPFLAELELAGDQRDQYNSVVQRWDAAQTLCLKAVEESRETPNAIERQTAAENQFTEESQKLIGEIRELLLPHQLEIVQLVLRRFQLRGMGITNLINQPGFRDKLKISLQEWERCITGRDEVQTRLVEKVAALQTEVFAQLQSGLSPPISDHLAECFEEIKSRPMCLEVLDWQFSLVENKAAVIDNSIGYRSLCKHIKFQIAVDGSIQQEIFDRQTPDQLISIFQFMVKNDELQTVLMIPDQDRKTALTWHDEYEIQSQALQADLHAKKLTMGEYFNETKKVDDDLWGKIENLVVKPREQAFNDVATICNVRRIGPCKALLEGYDPSLKLSVQDRDRLISNVKQARKLIKDGGRRISEEIFEIQLSQLEPDSRQRVRDYFGPELKFSSANLLIEDYNLTNLR